MGYPPQGFGGYGIGCSAMVEACVGAYSQTMAMCPISHWRDRGDGGRDRVTNLGAVAGDAGEPNDYQTASDFIMNAVRSALSRRQRLCAGAAQ